MKKVCYSFILILSMLSMTTAFALDKSENVESFIHDAFYGEVPERQKIKLDADLKDQIKKILGHRMRGSRLRYWQQDDRTVWILEEVGKTKPITTGLIVVGGKSDGKIEQLKVLKFRESRGGEIRYPFFTDQFKGVGLDDRNDLDQSIDGISGATLSVRAMKKLARVAILLHNHVSVHNTDQE